MNKVSALIIDDNPDDRYLLKRQLRELDLVQHIFEAEHGLEAINFLSDKEKNETLSAEGYPPKLIFLDINMPIMGGFAFLERFQSLKKAIDLESAIVLMCTTSDNIEDQRMALSYDFVRGFIVKMPKNSLELGALIRKYLSTNPA